MDDSDLRDQFREEFDEERPDPKDYQSAVRRALERPPSRIPGWAAPVAALLAVTMVTTAVLGSRSLLLQPSSKRVTTQVLSSETTLGQGDLGSAGLTEAPGVHVAARSSRLALFSAGDVIEKTEDGGASWSVLFGGMQGHRGTVRDLQWVTGAVAFAATSYGLMRLDTGRSHFSMVNDRADISRIDFLSPLEGYAIAEDRVVKTADGGRTFSDLDVGLTLVDWIQWISTAEAWAAGPRGVVATVDGGRTWTHELTFEDAPDSSSPQPATQVQFSDAMNGFAYHRAGESSALLHTSDGGRNWVPAPTVPEGATSDLVVTGPESAEVVQLAAPGRPSLCSTYDAGMSWRCSGLPISGSPGQLVVKGAARWLALLDSDAVFAVSQNGRSWSLKRQPMQSSATPSPSASPVGR